jgi:hypothetical protein
MATTIRAHIYASGEVSFAKFLFLPSWFAKLLEANFSCFAKIIWITSWFAKLFELLLMHPIRTIWKPAPVPKRERPTHRLRLYIFYLHLSLLSHNLIRCL